MEDSNTPYPDRGAFSDLEASAPNLLTKIDPEGPIEGVVLLRKTGTPLVSWAKQPEAYGVLPVMAATLLASVTTLQESLGSSAPDSVLVETEAKRFLASKVDGQSFLLLAASRKAETAYLHDQARRLISAVPESLLRRRRRPAPTSPHRDVTSAEDQDD